MENIWMRGQRSALRRCSLGPAVQTEESLDSDARLSPREGAGVSADINPPPLTSTPPQFQPRRLQRFGARDGTLGEEAGASCGGRARWKSHHTVTFELECVRDGCDIPHVYSCGEGFPPNLWCSATCPRRGRWGPFGFFGLNKTQPRPHI